MNKKIISSLFFILIIGSLIIFLYLFLFPSMQPIHSNLLFELGNKYGCVFENGKDKTILNYKYEEYYDSKYNSCPINISYIKSNDSKQLLSIYQYYANKVANNSNISGKSNININLGTKFYDKETSGDYFKSANLFEDTILFISCPKEYRHMALNIKKELGYYYEPNWNKLILLFVPTLLFFIYDYLILSKKFKK